VIGKFERHCPKCGAGICRYNAGAFCWPCEPPEGFVWHWSALTHEWVEIPVLKVAPAWEPEPGDIVLGQSFSPAPRKRDTGSGGDDRTISMSEAKERYNRERRQARQPRLERVKRRFEEGSTYKQIAEAEGISQSLVSQDVQWHRRRGDCLPRNRRLDSLTDEQIAEIEQLWNIERLSAREIGKRFGWSKPETDTVVGALRGRGFDLPPRRAQPVLTAPTDDKRRLKREFKKRSAKAARDLPDGEKAVLRLLAAAHRPLAAAELHRFLSECGQRLSKQAVRNRLLRAEKHGRVARARPDVRHYFERGAGRWFIPLEAEKSAGALTLADAERETELAAAIESQQDELGRGEWVDSEKGHWADRSIDAPLTADGFTILDTLGDEDEALEELIGEAA